MSNCQATGAADFQMIIALGTGAAAFTGGNGLRLFPLECGLGTRINTRQRKALRGGVGIDKDDIDQGVQMVGGSVVLEPGRAELNLLLPLILGALEGTSGDADTFKPSNALRPFRAQTKRGGIYTDFQDLYVNTATLSGGEGTSIRLELDLIGKTAVDLASGTFGTNLAAATVPTTAQRSVAFQEGALSIDSTAMPISKFTTTIDNKLEASFYSSKTAQCIERNDSREIRYRFELPQNTTTEPIWSQGFDFLDAVLSFIAGDSTEFSIDYTALHYENVLPLVPGPGKLGVNLEGLALASGATPEIVITNNPVAA